MADGGMTLKDSLEKLQALMNADKWFGPAAQVLSVGKPYHSWLAANMTPYDARCFSMPGSLGIDLCAQEQETQPC